MPRRVGVGLSSIVLRKVVVGISAGTGGTTVYPNGCSNLQELCGMLAGPFKIVPVFALHEGPAFDVTVGVTEQIDGAIAIACGGSCALT